MLVVVEDTTHSVDIAISHFSISPTLIEAAMAPPSRGPGRTPPVLLLSTLTPIALVLIGHPLLPLLLPSKLVHALTERIPLPPQPTFPALQANIGFSLLAFVGAILVVPEVGDAFIAKGLKGRDMLKPGGRISGPWM